MGLSVCLSVPVASMTRQTQILSKNDDPTPDDVVAVS